ncbi:TrmH family RNA methyltransferase [Plebeiibacterium marinum]|uniref:TrmH family RNA methyltransferase n=1 Tax=Plebeiibacterium marinum TaxID=2992111 RepID=A0AAE3MGA5_9BACT|nr:TrmH family RNA methyltransferase [Plebeiobacterium marinum]MCW3807214.1 TrmH family RNA methyltransferase [Plebeiobacterium marinum]
MKNKSTKSSLLFETREYSLGNEGPIIVAYQLKSPENMGHIIRLASNFGCRKVIFVGDELSVRASKIKKVAGAAQGQVEWSFVSEDCWMDSIDAGYELVAIETADNSNNIFLSNLKGKVAFLLGNEIYGLADELVQKCSQAVHIPMVGAIKSMNVSHACGVAMYEWVRQNLI